MRGAIGARAYQEKREEVKAASDARGSVLSAGMGGGRQGAYIPAIVLGYERVWLLWGSWVLQSRCDCKLWALEEYRTEKEEAEGSSCRIESLWREEEEKCAGRCRRG